MFKLENQTLELKYDEEKLKEMSDGALAEAEEIVKPVEKKNLLGKITGVFKKND